MDPRVAAHADAVVADLSDPRYCSRDDLRVDVLLGFLVGAAECGDHTSMFRAFNAWKETVSELPMVEY